MRIIIYIAILTLYSNCTNKQKSQEDFIKKPSNQIILGERKDPYIDSASFYSKIIEIDPTDANAYKKRAQIKSFFLKDSKGAIVDVSKAIELNPNDLDAYYFRGLTKSLLQDHRGAIADFSKVIKLDPTVEIYSSRGRSKNALGDYKGAIKDYDKAIELNPKGEFFIGEYKITLGSNYYDRGIAKINLGDKIGGCLDLSKAGELGGMGTFGKDIYDEIRKYCD